MELFILLVGMVLILEGLPYVAAPKAMRGWLKKLSEMSAQELRSFGLMAMGAGVFICWLVQGTSLFR